MTALHDTTDNAEGTLLAGISAAALSFTLQTAEGAEFPQPENGTADSPGDATTLNDSGDLGGLVVGQFIRNVTDGSYAVVLVTGAGTITTTRLKEGSDNLWESGDEWQANEFVVTFEKRTGTTVTAREKALIEARSTDLFTVRTRGFDGATAQTFDAGDFVNLHTVSNTVDDIIQVINNSIKLSNTLETNIESNDTELDNLRDATPFFATDTGAADAYAIAVTPAQTAYVAGQVFRFVAANANTGASTLDVSSLGTKDIRKSNLQVLVSGDILANQAVEVVFDGTQFLMISPIGTTPSAKLEILGSGRNGTSVSNTAVETNMSFTGTIPANSLSVGDMIVLEVFGEYQSKTTAAGTIGFGLKFNATVISSVIPVIMLDNQPLGRTCRWTMYILVDSIGASGTVQAWKSVDNENSNPNKRFNTQMDNTTITIDTTVSITVQPTVQFSVADANNQYVPRLFLIEQKKS